MFGNLWNGIYCLRKNRGDRGSPPCDESLYRSISVTLITSIVAPNSFNLAISDAFVRIHPDNSHNNHSNGGEYKCTMSPSFHYELL